ncbi:hypothetical protein [Paraclostridium dentum]|uniref:hypothetical protein n=1 Tax=Paraclostridium dentum TaxID=2662455 RepID=UPI003F2DA7AB
MKATELLNKYRLDLKRNERQREVCIERGEKTTKLRNQAKGLRACIANLENNVEVLDTLKARTYYVVEIAGEGRASSHKAIMVTDWDCGAVTVFNDTYDEGKIRQYRIESIRYIEIISEIEGMK